MPSNVTIMNWNVQNFGEAKSGLQYGNFDVVYAIASVVVTLQVDIFVLLEVNTTSADTARTLVRNLRIALNRWSSELGFNDTYAAMISPNTGREFYAFFIRDTAVVAPAPVVGSMVNGQPTTVVPTTLGAAGIPVTDAIFGAVTAKTVVGHGWAPLLSPDLNSRPSGLRPQIPDWPGTRMPALGLFHLPGASNANRWLPIIACHFAADAGSVTQTQQVQTLPYFSLMRGLAPGAAAPVTLQVVAPGGAQAPYVTNDYVFLGDFNLDWNLQTIQYQPLYGAAAPNLDTTAGQITANTLLVTPGVFNTRDYHTTTDLGVRCYDNFFLRVNPHGVAPAVVADSTWVDIAKQVAARTITLADSPAHFGELDQKGFASGNYQWLVRDYTAQLADPNAIIGLPAALLGARLVSDHLPVTLTLTIN